MQRSLFRSAGIITISLFIFFFIYQTFRDGMFMDGQQYACVAKNMSHGYGSFWFPYISTTWERGDSNVFLEQPPLGFGLQSLFFRVLGDDMIVERLYSVIMALLNVFMMFRIWKKFVSPQWVKKTFWLPVLMWILIPVVYWSYNNNVMEDTMSIFVTAAVLFLLEIYFSHKNEYLFLTLSGIAIVAASLTKGVPGFFPLSIPFLYWLIYRKNSFGKITFHSLFLLAVVSCIYFLIIQNEEAWKSLSFYVRERLLYRIENDPTTGTRIYILERLLAETAIPLVIIGLVFVAYRKKLSDFFAHQLKKDIYFFLLIGAAGTLPLMLTQVQRGFYMLPALLFFAVAFALVLLPFVRLWLENGNTRKNIQQITFWFACVLFAFSIFISVYGFKSCGRDCDELTDTYAMVQKIPSNSTVAATIDILQSDWHFRFYMNRHGMTSFGLVQDSTKFFITYHDNSPGSEGESFTDKIYAGKKYDLYKRKN